MPKDDLKLSILDWIQEKFQAVETCCLQTLEYLQKHLFCY